MVIYGAVYVCQVYATLRNKEPFFHYKLVEFSTAKNGAVSPRVFKGQSLTLFKVSPGVPYMMVGHAKFVKTKMMQAKIYISFMKEIRFPKEPYIQKYISEPFFDASDGYKNL